MCNDKGLQDLEGWIQGELRGILFGEFRESDTMFEYS
jgi:hypothetical protein